MKRKISDVDSCDNNSAGHESDFLFGFNDSRFSDRELIVEILADGDPTHPQSVVESSSHSNDQSSSQEVVESSHSNDDQSCSSQECSRVTKLHVSSLLLAAKSPFFCNLFTNGMMESEQKSVTLRIHANEEAAFMEIMNYMYSGALTSQTAPALVNVLKLADKFQVLSCMKLCSSLLQKLPMSTDSAFLYLDLTSSLPMAVEVQSLADASKQFLAAKYKDIGKVWHEIMEIPLAGVEAILSSDVLRVSSEDDLFRFVLRWTATHYPKLEEQKKILSAHLVRYIRFRYMSLEKLREALSCNVLDRDVAYKAVVDALFFKLTNPHQHHSTKLTSNSLFPRRDYKRWPVKVMEFELPSREIVIYVDLKFNECAKLKPFESLYSETFNFCGRPYFLRTQCLGGPDPPRSFFSVALGSDVAKRLPFALEFKFSVRSQLTKRFVVKCSGLRDCADNSDVRLYMVPWLNFEDEQILDHTDGTIYVEVKLTIK